MKIKLNSPWLKLFPSWVDAFAMFGTVHVRKDTISQKLLRHEMKHLQQQARYGMFLFVLAYLSEFVWNLAFLWSFKQAYKNISFEVEAREAEKE